MAQRFGGTDQRSETELWDETLSVPGLRGHATLGRLVDLAQQPTLSGSIELMTGYKQPLGANCDSRCPIAAGRRSSEVSFFQQKLAS